MRASALHVGVVLIVLAAAGVAGAIWQLRRDAESDVLRDSSNLALVVAEQTSRAVQAVDIVLQGLVEEVDRFDTRNADEFAVVMGSSHIHERLVRHVSQLSQIQALAVIGPSGRIIGSSRSWPVRPFDVSDREIFRHFAGSEDQGIFFSAPVLNRVVGTWTIHVGRRMTAPNGEFLGVIVATIDSEYFSRIFTAMNLSRSERLLLLRDDGTNLLRHPVAHQLNGSKLPDGTPWYSIVATGGGHYNSAGPFTGNPSLVIVSLVPGYKLVINVLVPHAKLYATWKRQLAMIGSGGAVLLGCAAVLLLIVKRQVRQLNLAKDAARDRNAQLQVISEELHDSKALLETTVHSMDQGIILIDQNGTVVLYNERVLDLLDLPDALLKRRPSWTEVLRHQWEKRASQKGDFEAFRRARSDFSEPSVGELTRPDGRILEIRSAPTGSQGAIRMYTDVTARALAERRAKYLAGHDELTRLMNRAQFGERLADAVEEARAGRRGLVLMYLDLDGFKQVNDTFGHPVGDELLARVAHRMRSCVRASDMVARTGGDEFALILPAHEDMRAALAIATKLIEAVGAPCTIEGEAIRVGASIGLAAFPEHGTTSADLRKHADAALYKAKRSGKNVARVFTPTLDGDRGQGAA